MSAPSPTIICRGAAERKRREVLPGPFVVKFKLVICPSENVLGFFFKTDDQCSEHFGKQYYFVGVVPSDDLHVTGFTGVALCQVGGIAEGRGSHFDEVGEDLP